MAVEWSNFGASNPYPRPGEDITITAFAGGTYGGFDFRLIIDELELARYTMVPGPAWVYFTIRAPYLPGPYSYVIEHLLSYSRSPPIGILVMEEPPPPPVTPSTPPPPPPPVPPSAILRLLVIYGIPITVVTGAVVWLLSRRHS